MQLPELFLALLVFFYSLNLGPMIFESFTSDRIWASDPPDSFYMFLGEHGHKTAHYWRIVSPLAILSFVLSVIFNWSVVDRRLWLSIALVLYLAVQISTMAYFVPEQERLISSADSPDRKLLKARRRSVDISELFSKCGRSACVPSLAACDSLASNSLKQPPGPTEVSRRLNLCARLTACQPRAWSEKRPVTID